MPKKIDKRKTMNMTKRMLADDLGLGMRDVILRLNLRSDLGYSEAGVRGLTPIINNHFQDYDVEIVDPDLVAICASVLHLVVLMWNLIPVEYKE